MVAMVLAARGVAARVAAKAAAGMVRAATEAVGRARVAAVATAEATAARCRLDLYTFQRVQHHHSGWSQPRDCKTHATLTWRAS